MCLNFVIVGQSSFKSNTYYTTDTLNTSNMTLTNKWPLHWILQIWPWPINDLHIEYFKYDLDQWMSSTLNTSDMTLTYKWPSLWILQIWPWPVNDLYIEYFRYNLDLLMTFTLNTSNITLAIEWPLPLLKIKKIFWWLLLSYIVAGIGNTRQW